MTFPDKCKYQLMQRLLWDVRKTEDAVNYWESEQNDRHRDLVIATFVQTEGGLTRIYPPYETEHLTSETDPSRSLIFQRAYYGEEYVFLPPKPVFGMCSNLTYEAATTIVKSISFSRGGVTYKPAVVGVMVDPMWLQPYLLTTPSAKGKGPRSCADADDIVCYLIDDGGFLISTNQLDHMDVIGKFMGYTDPELMAKLVDEKIYEKNEEFNYEGRCEKEINTNAGLRTAHLPLYSILSSFNLNWLLDKTAWSQFKFWIYGFFTSMLWRQTEALPEFYERSNETTCTTHKAQYFLGRWGRTSSGDFRSKNNCTRYYSLAKVGKMNILLVVSSKPCAPSSCDTNPIPKLVQKSVKYTGEDKCDRPIRYHLRPKNCFSYDEEEDYSVCFSTATFTAPSLSLTVGVFSVLILTALTESSPHLSVFSSNGQ